MRFQRMKNLAEIGDQGMDLLKSSHVTVIGLGGLGCPVVLYLAAMGVGHLHLVDGDIVAESNLSRQILYGSGDIGKLKTTAVKEYLLKYHPQINITTSDMFLNLDLARCIFPLTDVIVDASDNFKTNYLINDIAKLLKKAVVYGAVTQWSGRVAVFKGAMTGCLRCIYAPPVPGTIENCSVNGVISAMAGMVGTFQAGEVIKVLLFNAKIRHQYSVHDNLFKSFSRESVVEPTLHQKDFRYTPSPTPYLHVFDMLNGNFLNLTWKPRPNCFCSSPHLDLQKEQPTYIDCKDRNLAIGDFSQFEKSESLEKTKNIENVEHIGRMENIKNVEKTKKTIILDVREAYETDFRFKETIHIPLSVLDQTEINLPIDVPIEVICASGQRAKLAVSILRRSGFPHAFAYNGNIESFYYGRGMTGFS